MIGLLTTVELRKVVVCRVSSRPRMCGGVRGCMILFVMVRNAALLMFMGTVMVNVLGRLRMVLSVVVVRLSRIMVAVNALAPMCWCVILKL